MKNWILISLYILQTIVGAVVWRKLFKDNKDGDGFGCFILSAVVLPNIIFIIAGLWAFISALVDFLAGVKNNEQ